MVIIKLSRVEPVPQYPKTLPQAVKAIEVKHLTTTSDKRESPGQPCQPELPEPRAAHDVPLEVEHGRINSTLGRASNSKSGLTRAIGTLLVPDGSKVRPFGRDHRRNKGSYRPLLNGA